VFILFISDFFHDTVSFSDYIALNGKVVGNDR
jgi:hypothetical protein